MPIYTKNPLKATHPLPHISVPITIANMPKTDYFYTYSLYRPVIYDSVSLHHVLQTWDYDKQFKDDERLEDLIYSLPDADAETRDFSSDTIRSVSCVFQISGMRNTLSTKYGEFIDRYNEFYDTGIPGGGYYWSPAVLSATATDMAFLFNGPDYARVYELRNPTTPRVDITQTLWLGLTRDMDKKFLGDWEWFHQNQVWWEIYYPNEEPPTEEEHFGGFIAPPKTNAPFMSNIFRYTASGSLTNTYGYGGQLLTDIDDMWNTYAVVWPWILGYKPLPCYMKAKSYSGEASRFGNTPIFVVSGAPALDWRNGFQNMLSGGAASLGRGQNSNSKYYHKLGYMPPEWVGLFDNIDNIKLSDDPYLTNLIDKHHTIYSSTVTLEYQLRYNQFRHDPYWEGHDGQPVELDEDLRTYVVPDEWKYYGLYPLRRPFYDSYNDYFYYGGAFYWATETAQLNVQDMAYWIVVSKKSVTNDYVDLIKDYYGWTYDGGTRTVSANMTIETKEYKDTQHLGSPVGGLLARPFKVYKVTAPNADLAERKFKALDCDVVGGSENGEDLSFTLDENTSETDNIYYCITQDTKIFDYIDSGWSSKTYRKSCGVSPPHYTVIGGSQWWSRSPWSPDIKFSDSAYGKDLDFGQIGRRQLVLSDLIDPANNPGGYNSFGFGYFSSDGPRGVDEMSDANLSFTVARYSNGHIGNPNHLISYMRIIYAKTNPSQAQFNSSYISFINDLPVDQCKHTGLLLGIADNSEYKKEGSEEYPTIFRKLPDYYNYGTKINGKRNVYELQEPRPHATIPGIDTYDTMSYGLDATKRFNFQEERVDSASLFPKDDIRHAKSTLIFHNVRNDEFRVNIDDYYGQSYGSNKGLIQ